MAAKIGIKTSAAGYSDVKQPSIKLGDNAWHAAKRVLVKAPDNTWQEVWPGAIIYIHTGLAYAMNVAACFGNPTQVGNYLFINNGKIGGAAGQPALRTGVLPAGSTLSIINNGTIEGIGGKGGWYDYVRTKTSKEHGGSCFTADSLILMADGSLKRIDEIAVGDCVKTAFGESNVVYIQMPVLGDRNIVIHPGDKCKTSAEHPLWAKNKITGEQWWATRDLQQWTLEHDESVAAGLVVTDKPAILITDPENWMFATIDGWVDANWIELKGDPATQLYHLHLDNSGGYFVDGYLVEDGGVAFVNDELVKTNYLYGDDKWLSFDWNSIWVEEK